MVDNDGEIVKLKRSGSEIGFVVNPKLPGGLLPMHWRQWLMKATGPAGERS